jgi:D-alanyl-D-alanine carboxypeptidase
MLVVNDFRSSNHLVIIVVANSKSRSITKPRIEIVAYTYLWRVFVGLAGFSVRSQCCVTQKPDSSQRPTKSIRVWVNASTKGDRSTRLDPKHQPIGDPDQPAPTVDRFRFPCFPFLFLPRWRQRIWLIWVVGWGLGMVTALMPIAVTQISRSSVVPLWSEAIVQAVPSFVPLSSGSHPDADDFPRATVGLTQPALWSHAATLAAHFGHLPYSKAEPQSLTPFPNQSSPYPYARRSGEYLHPEAATALKSMMDAARSDGVWIVLISGFRDLTSQHRLFEERTEGIGSVEEAARFVAPPGYSEHHTGYAIDVTDGSGLGFYAFEQTAAFRWMQSHAHEFGFELSFPANNPQGIDYEPWHWRFVASPEAARTFAAARG